MQSLPAIANDYKTSLNNDDDKYYSSESECMHDRKFDNAQASTSLYKKFSINMDAHLSNHVKRESIYTINSDKVLTFKLPADSAAMTFAACLKPKFNGNLQLRAIGRSDVFINSLIVHMLQFSMIYFIWYYALEDDFKISLPKNS